MGYIGEYKQIYAIKHNITNRCYVGYSQSPEYRIKDHLAALKRHSHPSSKMQEDFEKYGENYSFYGLELVPDETLIISENPYRRYYLPKLREAAWMDKLNSIKNGYNHQDKTAEAILKRANQ